MFSGIEIGLYEILLFFFITTSLKKKVTVLSEINSVAYYWIMMTILTGLWEFSFITNYRYVNVLSENFIKTKTHVWKSEYNISYILPWRLAYIFYAEYGAYADREYMVYKDDWSRVIEGTHAIFCAFFCLLCVYYKLQYKNVKYNIAISVAMGSQLMNSILYLMNYFIQCNDPGNINYNSSSFPTGNGLIKRPFMYVNIFWFLMPLYVILHLLSNNYK